MNVNKNAWSDSGSLNVLCGVSFSRKLPFSTRRAINDFSRSIPQRFRRLAASSWSSKLHCHAEVAGMIENKPQTPKPLLNYRRRPTIIIDFAAQVSEMLAHHFKCHTLSAPTKRSSMARKRPNVWMDVVLSVITPITYFWKTDWDGLHIAWICQDGVSAVKELMVTGHLSRNLVCVSCGALDHLSMFEVSRHWLLRSTIAVLIAICSNWDVRVRFVAGMIIFEMSEMCDGLKVFQFKERWLPPRRRAKKLSKTTKQFTEAYRSSSLRVSCSMTFRSALVSLKRQIT